MVTCTIVIKEFPPEEGGVRIAMDIRPDNSKGTELERKLSGCFEVGLQAVSTFIMSKVKNGEMIHGQDIDEHCNAMLKRHFAGKSF